MGLSFADRALREPTVLVLSPDDGVSDALAALFAPHGIHVAVPRLAESVRDAVSRTAADVVLVSSACGDEAVGTIIAESRDGAEGAEDEQRADAPRGERADAATFVPVLLFAPDASATALEATGRVAVEGLAQRYDIPFLELSRDVASVALQLRLLAGRQTLS